MAMVKKKLFLVLCFICAITGNAQQNSAHESALVCAVRAQRTVVLRKSLFDQVITYAKRHDKPIDAVAMLQNALENGAALTPAQYYTAIEQLTALIPEVYAVPYRAFHEEYRTRTAQTKDTDSHKKDMTDLTTPPTEHVDQIVTYILGYMPKQMPPTPYVGQEGQYVVSGGLTVKSLPDPVLITREETRAYGIVVANDVFTVDRDTGSVTIATGGLSAGSNISSGAAISATGTITSGSTLTVSSGGATIAGDSSITGTANVNINTSGTAITNISTSTSGSSVHIADGTATGTVTIGNSTGKVGIGGDVSATNGVILNVTGDTTTSGALTMTSDTAVLAVNDAGGHAKLSVNPSSGGTVSIATNASNPGQVAIGSTTSGSGITISAATGSGGVSAGVYIANDSGVGANVAIANVGQGSVLLGNSTGKIGIGGGTGTTAVTITGDTTVSGTATITGLANANSNFVQAGSGGTLSAATQAISTSTASTLVLRDSSKNFATNAITGLATLTNSSDTSSATNKSYVDALSSGLHIVDSVKAKSTVNITTRSGTPSPADFDGVSLTTGDYALLNNQATQSQNGLWTIDTSGAWTQGTPLFVAGQNARGALTEVLNGATNAGTLWLCNSPAPSIIGTNDIYFGQFFEPRAPVLENIGSGSGTIAVADTPGSIQQLRSLTASGPITISTGSDSVTIGSTGNVAGPGPTVTTNSITIFDGTGGYAIKSANATIDGSGNISAGGSVTGTSLTASAGGLSATGTSTLSTSVNTQSITVGTSGANGGAVTVQSGTGKTTTISGPTVNITGPTQVDINLSAGPVHIADSSSTDSVTIGSSSNIVSIGGVVNPGGTPIQMGGNTSVTGSLATTTTVTAGTGITVSAGGITSTGAISLSTSANDDMTIGSTGTNGGNVTVQSGDGKTTAITGPTVNIAGSTQTDINQNDGEVHIADGTNAHLIAIGNVANTASIALNCKSTGTITATGPTTIAGTTTIRGNTTINDQAGSSTSIGTSANNGAITIGNVTNTPSINLNANGSSTGITLTGPTNINTNSSSTTTIGYGGTGSVIVGNSTGNVGIGGAANTHQLKVYGTTEVTDALTVDANGITVSAGGGTISGGLTVSSGDINLDVTGSNMIHIGDGSGAQTIDIGNTGASVTVLGQMAINTSGTKNTQIGTSGNYVGIGAAADGDNMLLVTGKTKITGTTTLVTLGDGSAAGNVVTVDGSGVLTKVAASSTNTPGAIVQRDASGDFATNKITGLATPTGTTDAANKAYVDAHASGLKPIAPALVYSASNVANICSGTLPSIDGVAIADGNRILLGGQTNLQQMGVWVAHDSPTAWARPSDFAQGTGAANTYLSITSGTTYGGSSWVCNTPSGSDTIGDCTHVGSDLSFVEFSTPSAQTMENIGTGDGTIWAQKVGNTQQFKSLAVGGTLSIANGTATITISNANSGYVTGPGSATANELAVFADTTGKVVKASMVTADTSGNMTVPGTLTVNGLLSETGGSDINVASGSVNIASTTNTDTVTIGNASGTGATVALAGTVKINDNAGAMTTNIGTTGTTGTVTIGNTSNTVALAGGTITADGNTTINGSSSTGTTNIGTSTNAGKVTIGNTSLTNGVEILAGTAGVNINDTGTSATTIGNDTSGGSVSIKALQSIDMETGGSSSPTITIGTSDITGGGINRTITISGGTISSASPSSRTLELGVGTITGTAANSMTLKLGDVAVGGTGAAKSFNIEVGKSAITSASTKTIDIGTGTISGSGSATVIINMGSGSMTGTAASQENINIGVGDLTGDVANTRSVNLAIGNITAPSGGASAAKIVDVDLASGDNLCPGAEQEIDIATGALKAEGCEKVVNIATGDSYTDPYGPSIDVGGASSTVTINMGGDVKATGGGAIETINIGTGTLSGGATNQKIVNIGASGIAADDTSHVLRINIAASEVTGTGNLDGKVSILTGGINNVLARKVLNIQTGVNTTTTNTDNRTINIGAAGYSTVTSIHGVTNINSDITDLAAVTIGNASAGGNVTVQATSGNTVAINPDTSTTAITTLGSTGSGNVTLKCHPTSGAKISATGPTQINASQNSNTDINIGTSTGTVTIGNTSATVAIVGTTTINSNAGTCTTNIGTGSTTGKVTIGSTGLSSGIQALGASVNVNDSGSGTTQLGNTSGGTVTIQTGGTNAVNINTAGSTAVTTAIGNSAAGNITLTSGGTISTAAPTLGLNTTGTGNTNINGTSNSGTVSVGNTSSGTITLQGGTTDGVKINTGAVAAPTTIGNAATAGTITLQTTGTISATGTTRINDSESLSTYINSTTGTGNVSAGNSSNAANTVTLQGGTTNGVKINTASGVTAPTTIGSASAGNIALISSSTISTAGTTNINDSQSFNTNINTTTGTGNVSVGNSSNTANTVTLQGGVTNGVKINTGAVAAPTTIGGPNAGTITIQAANAAAVNINTGASTATTTIGSATSGAISLVANASSISATGATNINVDQNFATNINTGTSTGAVAVGNSGTAGNAVTILGGSTGGVNINSTGAGVTTVGSTSAGNTTIQAGNSSNFVYINPTGSASTNINYSTNTGSVNIGNTNSTSAVNIRSGSGAINLNVGVNSPVNIQTTGSGTTTIGNAASSFYLNAGTSNILTSASNLLRTSENPTQLRLIRGTINGSTGATTYGSGFTSSRSSTGTYIITFTGGLFSGVPSITATAYNTSSKGVVCEIHVTPTTGGFGLTTINNQGGSAADSDFGFMAIGPTTS